MFGKHLFTVLLVVVVVCGTLHTLHTQSWWDYYPAELTLGRSVDHPLFPLCSAPSDKAYEYQLPYQEFTARDPPTEDMRLVVCEQGKRPYIPHTWEECSVSDHCVCRGGWGSSE